MSTRQGLLGVHARLHLIRACEELILLRYADDEMKTPMHMSWGQEACAVGVSEGVGPLADFFGTYRSHGLYLSRTLDPYSFFAELLGRDSGKNGGVGGSMHLADISSGVFSASAIVGGNISLAVGAAFAHRKLKNGRIAVTVFGDGALDGGTFWESLNLAQLYEVPVIFVLEDNGLAVHSGPTARRSWGLGGSLEQTLAGFGLDYYQVPSTNVHEIAEAVAAVAQTVRKTFRPAFIHLNWHRFLEHVGINADASAAYRIAVSATEMDESDPVQVSREFLHSQGIPEAELNLLEKCNQSEVLRAYESASNAPFRSLSEASQWVQL